MSLEVKPTVGSTTSTVIPQILTHLKVNQPIGTQVNITKLYTNNSDGGVDIVWDTTITPPTQTDIGTNIDPVAPICGVCCAAELRYWPALPTLKGRWDCTYWKNTAKILHIAIPPNGTLGSTHVLRDPYNDLGLESPIGDRPYALVYASLDNAGTYTGTPLSPCVPPPLNHVVVDYAHGDLSDRLMIYDSLGFAGSPTEAEYTSLLLPPTATNNPFGSIISSGAKYRFVCSDYTHIDNARFLCNTTPPPVSVRDSADLCECTTSECPYGSVPPLSSTGGSCTPIANIIQPYHNMIVDTGCINTGPTVEPSTVCYGNPILFTDGPSASVPMSATNPFPRQHNRDVGYLPNIVIGKSAQMAGKFGTPSLSGTVKQHMFDSAYSIWDFSVVSDNGCDPTECMDPQNGHCSGTTWSNRIFLPFYLNVPASKVTDSGSPDPSSVSLYGKIIQFTKGGHDIEDPLWDLQLGIQDVPSGQALSYVRLDPPLQQMYHLLRGNIKASCIVMGNAYEYNLDTALFEIKPDKLIWGAVGYPSYINNRPTHTHQLVIEYIHYPNESDCNICFNREGNGGLNGPVGSSVNIRKFRLYPITNSTGTDYIQPLKDTIQNSRILGSNTGGNINNGIKDLNIIRRIINATGELGLTDGELTLGGLVYTDEFNPKAGVAITSNAPISCANILNTIQQPKIDRRGVTPSTYDCNCQTDVSPCM